MEELIAKLRERFKDGEKFVIHKCLGCNYPCGFSWMNGKLFYDSGCNCTNGAGGFEPLDEGELYFYLDQQVFWDRAMAAVS